MKDLLLHTTSLSDYKASQTSTTINVPVVMMVEGVHHGSGGPIMHTSAGLEASVEQWNGKPVVIYHPQDSEGNYISAESEGVVHVGVISNTRWDSGKLKADLILNTLIMASASPKAVEYIVKGRPIDVSIGAYPINENISGEWNGETYIATTIAYEPDHLAILPGEVGACSWDDGCGIRVNSKQDNKPKMKGGQMFNVKESIKELLDNGHVINVIQGNAEQGYREKMDKLYTLVNSLDSDMYYHYVEDMFNDYVIYRRESKGTPRTESRWYKQDYEVVEDQSIQFMGEPERVLKQVEYKPVQINEQNNKTKGETEMNKAERVAALIANKGFSKCDEQMLLQASEEQLSVFEQSGKPKTEELNDSIVTTYVGKKSKEQIIELLPESIRESVKQGMLLYAEKRNATIEKIMTNSGTVWTKEELEVMSDSMLEKVSKTTVAPTDYSAAGGQRTPSTQKGIEEPLYPVGVKIEEQK